MNEHPIEGLMTTAMNSIRDMVDVNTIIGEAIEGPGNIMIIPISKVGFGFAAGGSEFNGETLDEYKKKEWLSTVNCSNNIAEIINTLHEGTSLKELNSKEKILTLRKEKNL